MKHSSLWHHPFRVVRISRDTNLQSFADRYSNLANAIDQVLKLARDRGDYFYILDLSALPTVEYPA